MIDTKSKDLTIAIVAIAKDKDNYLKEWVDYHLMIGVDDIFIFQNDWNYSRNDITDGRVHFGSVNGPGMQTSVYNYFICNFFSKYDFALFIDVDEFLWIKNGVGLKAFLETVQDIPAVFINWRLFGDNGMTSVSNGNYSVIQRFTRCSNQLHQLGKNLINFSVAKNSLMFYNPHILIQTQPQRELRVSDPARKHFTICGTIKDNIVDEPCEIYHFRNKTFEELKERKYLKQDVFSKTQSSSHTDIDVIKREFCEHNRNDVINTNLKDYMDSLNYDNLVRNLVGGIPTFSIVVGSPSQNVDMLVQATKNIGILNYEDYITNRPDFYSGWFKNQHHWTTKFVYNNVMPKIYGFLGVSPKPDDFELVSCFSDNNDISYHRYTGNKTFLFENIDDGYQTTGDHDSLRDIKFHKLTDINFTDYHRLFIGAHRNCKLTNLDSDNDIRLVINGDSMAIPIIPLIIPFVKQILVIDNHKYTKQSDVIKKFHPTHFLTICITLNVLSKEVLKKVTQ